MISGAALISFRLFSQAASIIFLVNHQFCQRRIPLFLVSPEEAKISS
jgi:hypothetical protein